MDLVKNISFDLTAASVQASCVSGWEGRRGRGWEGEGRGWEGEGLGLGLGGVERRSGGHGP